MSTIPDIKVPPREEAKTFVKNLFAIRDSLKMAKSNLNIDRTHLINACQSVNYFLGEITTLISKGNDASVLGPHIDSIYNIDHTIILAVYLDLKDNLLPNLLSVIDTHSTEVLAGRFDSSYGVVYDTALSTAANDAVTTALDSCIAKFD